MNGANVMDRGVMSFSAVQGLKFLASTAFGKIAVLAVLFHGGICLGEANPFTLLYHFFSEDLIASLSLFLLLYLTLIHVRNARLLGRLKGAVNVLQFLYLAYIMSYIEYFRIFSAQMDDSFFTALNELASSPASTLAFAYTSQSSIISLTYLLAYCAVVFGIWPRFERLQDISRPQLRPSSVFLIVSVIAAHLLLSSFVVSTSALVTKYGMGYNPLLNLFASVTDVYYPSLGDLADGVGGRERLLSQRILIDPEYPLMTGTEYAICGNPDTISSVEFESMCLLDEDGDGYTKQVDCEDRDKEVKPGATETQYNMVDEDCDGQDSPKMNVVVVLLESVSLDDMQFYGAQVENTPNLMEYEKWSFVSDNFWANSGRSVKAEFVIFCSLYPYRNFEDPKVYSKPYAPCLADIMKANGYRTSYFSPEGKKPTYHSRFVKAQSGWDVYVGKDDIETGGYFTSKSYNKFVEEKAMIEPFFSWVESLEGEAFFSVLRFHTAHIPIRVPKEYKVFSDPSLNAAYYVDSFIKDVVDGLMERELLEDSLVVVVGDHTSARQQQSRVPFILINPNLFSGERSSKPASQLDFAPTILEVLGIESINSFRGQSMFGLKEEDRVIFFSYKTQHRSLRQGEHEFSIYLSRGQKTLLRGGADVTQEEPELVARFERMLMEEFLASDELLEEDRIFRKDLFPK